MQPPPSLGTQSASLCAAAAAATRAHHARPARAAMAAVDASSLRLRELNGVKVYEVSSSHVAPEWAKEKNKRKLRKDADYQRRIELVQDLNFPSSSTRAKLSPDGQFLIVSGLHPPQVKCYDLSQLSMKWSRHLDAEVVTFQALSEDYAKLAFICADRSIRFHAKFGNYYQTRTPKQGRDMVYSRNTGDLCVVGSSSEVWRLNLEQGRFLAPLESQCEEFNVCGISPTHGLFAAASADGELECFDLRQRKSCGLIQCTDADEGGLTALRFDSNGMNVAVGSEGGIVRLYDLRSSRPVRVKDQMNGFPIIDLKYHNSVDGVRRLVSTDKKVVKIWDERTGDPYTSIEPGYEINDLCMWDNTGLMMLAMEHTEMSVFFTPTLGAAPKWCSFLENLTEEMEEQKNETIYDDYRFVTVEELDKLGLSHLIGTKMLRAYMHGYFMDNRLYGKAKAIAEPFSYDDFKKKKVKEKLDEERKSRITVKKKAPKVNALLAARLGTADAEGVVDDVDEDGDDVGTIAPGGSLLEDDRFAAMFKEKEFEIDEEDEQYKVLHPNASKLHKDTRREILEDHFELVSDEDDEPVEEVTTTKKKTSSEPKMYAAKDECHANAFKDGRVTKADLPLKERAKMERANEKTKQARVTGNREAFFDAGDKDKMKRLGESKNSDKYGDEEGLTAEGAWKDQAKGHSRGSRRGMDGVLGKQKIVGGRPVKGKRGKK